MKNILFLLAANVVFFSVHAQYLRSDHGFIKAPGKTYHAVSPQAVSTPAKAKTGAKTTTVTIATENFGSGTDTTLPTGWKAGITNGPGTWHWTNHASTSSNSLGVMNSTTAADGWMIFDADSFQTDCSCAPSGWLQSPAYNCSGHPTVRLNFENYFGQVLDTCEVWVSTDSAFGTYTVYPVTINNNLDFGNVTSNDNIVHIDISGAAAGHPAVYIRYVFRGTDFFELSWMIDDMSVTELEPHDAGVAAGYMWLPNSAARDGYIMSTPLVFVDSVFPYTHLSNYGSNGETNVPVAANIYLGSSSVYTQPTTFGSLPYAALDSVVHYPGYKPAATGTYSCVFNTSLTGDADHANDYDTVRFDVTDTLWMQNSLEISTNYAVYVASFGPPFAGMLGTRFDVPASSASDTVSGFGVAFSAFNPTPFPGTKVSVQLYKSHKTDTAWTYVGTSIARHVTTADFSSDTVIKWADFRIDTTGGVAPFVLEPGATYAAMIQTYHFNTDLFVLASAAPKLPGSAGKYLVFDTSNNDGGIGMHRVPDSSFSDGYIPFVRMYFGHVPWVDRTEVKSLPPVSLAGTPYPDPAVTDLYIPIDVNENTEVTVSLSNILAQNIRTQNYHVNRGAHVNAVFSVTNLPNGVYIYTVNAGGQKISGKIVVTH